MTDSISISTLDPCDLGLPEKFEHFRPEQVEAVDAILNTPKRFYGAALPTGAGKTLIAVAAARASGLRTVILTGTKGLQSQYIKDFADSGLTDIRGTSKYTCKAMPNLNCRMGASAGCPLCAGGGCTYKQRLQEARDADLIITNYDYWVAVNKFGNGLDTPRVMDMEGSEPKPVEMLIMDECFPAGTKVDDKPIESIQVGDRITSFNDVGRLVSSYSDFCEGYVVATSKRRTLSIVRLTFRSGKQMCCTKSHPFMTREGWLTADRLLERDVLCYQHESRRQENTEEVRHTGSTPLHGLREDNSTQQRAALLLPEVGESGLQHEVCSVDGEKQRESIASRTSEVSGENAARQSDALSRPAGKNENIPAGKRLETDSARRQWERTDSPTTCPSCGFGVGHGSSCIGETSKSRVSDPLQIGYSKQGSQDRSGDRWKEPRKSGETAEGSKEGPVLSYDRVVGVEVYERGSDPEFDQLCPGGVVYNFEVEGTHTYIAEGCVVHNCHNAFEYLGRAMRVVIKESTLIAADLDYQKSDDLKAWVSWALTIPVALKRSYQATMVKYKLTKQQNLLHRLYAMEELSSVVEEISRMTLDGWVCEMKVGTNYGRTWDFDPVWPGMYAESRLFCGVKKVVLMSATLRPASLAMLGINPREAEFREWPRVFPSNRTPVYAVPTIRMNHRNTEEDLGKWVSRIDEIIETRTERKGIIHTVSYSRQKYILEHSKYAAHMLANTNAPDSDSAMEIMSKFKASSAPSILVSPSFSTGVDFPGRDCEWQIICKVPFADLRSKVMAARNERNKTYVNYLAMQDIIQQSGRGTRFKLDRCEVFVIDSNVLWFFQQNKGLAPRWFELIRTERVPTPGLRVHESS